VEADRKQIEQVMLNLYINAWQAMPDGGEIYLETKTVALDEKFCLPYNAAPGDYAKISITDTGKGMSSSVLQCVFDPFFTTKEKGRGTGLGLASAYGIIKNHTGIITASSEVGQGATFDIYLPLSDQQVIKAKRPSEELIKGSETVLLVDDEKMILDVGQAMLEKLGYQVFVAQDGQAAVEIISANNTQIDLVILDLVMPEMDGDTTFDHIRAINPGIPVLLSSGYSVDGKATEILQKGCNGFIQKPFNISKLSQKIRQVLEDIKPSTQR
jgi:CheY-like chemotaxis protein